MQQGHGGGEYILTGRVVDIQTGQGLPDVRVEAWDKGRLCNDLVACTFSDALGIFRIVLETRHLRELFLDRVPVLFFRVFEGVTCIASTERSVVWRVDRPESAVRIELNRSTSTRSFTPGPFIVRGRVVTAAGAPRAGLVVRAYNRNLREEQLLGEATTSDTGSYRIAYAADKLAQDFEYTGTLLDVALFDPGPGRGHRKSAADLVVRVYDAERAVTAEKKLCHAPPTATVNLVMGGEIYRGPSAYERLVLLLAPAIRSASLTDLTGEDIRHLACSLRLDLDDLDALVTATQLARALGIHPAALYGLFHEGLPRERHGLLMTRPSEQLRALLLALEHNLIPAMLREQVDAILAALHKAAVQLAFEPVETGISLGDLLAIVLPARDAQEALVSAYLQYEGPVDSFWQGLRELPLFKEEGLVDRVQLAVQLATLSRHHLPLVRALDEWRRSGKWSSLADLARLAVPDWLGFLEKGVDGAPIGAPPDLQGADDKEKIANYALLLTDTLANTLPTAALAGQLQGKADQDLALFFSKNPDFEIGKTQVRSYLQEKPGALDGLSSPKTATADLEALERLFKVTPSPTEMNLLFSAGIHSAQNIQKLGKPAFIKSYSQVLGGQSKAESLFQKAQQITSGALALFGKFASIARPPGLYVLPAPDLTSTGDAAALMDIFGPQNLACEHCASIYGPAAYLVDVLDFLGRYPATQNKPGDPTTARDVLLARRPDLSRIELSCENTLTEVPYVDLADEILEFRLAHAVDPSVVLDAHIKTVGTAEELALSPQPIHGTARFTAYKALAQGKFPPAPPFNVWAEETDILLAHFGTSRAELVDVFSQAPATPAPPAPGLLDAFSALLEETKADASAFFSAVAERAGLPAADLDVLVNKLGLVFPSSCENEAAVGRLWNAIQVVKGLGVSATRAISWATTTAPIESADPAVLTAPALADDVRLAVKAKYTEDAWPEIGRVLRNDLRELQRKALVAAALALGKYDSTNELFAELLVDVEMSPKPTTSRIQQAISSVQRFVQRCFMGLEPAVTSFDDEAAAQWSWTKNSRVWEANRKIFFHPENWIEPELRDDKTPFFKELESELLQGDITDARAEGAFRKYLQKLHDVAHLNVVAICNDRDAGVPGGPTTAPLHIIARTHTTPRVYFYRQRLHGRFWTSWEKLDLDIQSDCFLAVVHNRRVYFFWALLEEAEDTGTEASPAPKGGKPTGYKKPKEYDLDDGGKPQPDIDVDIDEPHKSPGPKAPTIKKKPMRLRVAWSERQNGRWSPRKVGPEEPLAIAMPDGDPVALSLWPSLEAGKLAISCAVKEAAPPDRSSRVYQLVLGCDGRLEVVKSSATWKTSAVLGTSLQGMEFVPSDDTVGLWLRGFALTDKDVQVLGKTPGPYAMVVPHRGTHLALALKWNLGFPPFFYKDQERTFFVQMTQRPEGDVGEQEVQQNPWIQCLPGMPTGPFNPQIDIAPVVSVELEPRQVRFEVFYHPHACALLEALERDGIDGLFGWPANGKSVQLRSESFFDAKYAPTPLVVATPYPADDIDFSFGGAYSQYNWEVFFHAPFLIACMLMKNHRHEEAQRWFHRIFDPTPGAGSGPERFWKVKPLREKADPKTLASELAALAAGDEEAIGELAAQIEAWREEPFNPHLIARMRSIAYQRAVVMKYIDNLIAWGDYLFSQDTREAINEATGLYILAADILGPKPDLNKQPEAAPKTYAELLASAPLADLENLVPELNGPGDVPLIDAAHFAIPPNDKLLGYWDLVADRLFKVRHGLNIEGQARPLPLFAPPIDPALLVKAAAMGVDWKDVSEVVPMPHYRFGVLHAKAMEFCGGVIALGAALLSALEKKDAEKLTLLRATHEAAVLTATREVKKRQIDEAKQTLAGLKKTREAAAIRYQHYKGLPFMNSYEEQAMVMSGAAAITQALVQVTHTESAGAYLLPTAITGGAGIASPAALVVYGGENAAKSGESFGNALGVVASLMRDGAAMSATMGYYTRRAEDWRLQEKIAAKEIEQLDKQILAAEIRLALVEKDLDNHDLIVENAKVVEATLRDKFTNEALYSWTINEISTVYFDAYKLALGMARRAAKAFKHELAQDSPDVSLTHWDNTRNGLLAGEKLLQQLRQMEAAYLDKNKREYELTKHISLAQLAPQKLLELKQKGVCEFDVPELEFDLDFPGHYLRRIKTVSLSVPCVTDAYGTLNATLTLVKSRVRKSADLTGGYAEKLGDGRFTTPYVAPISLAISGAQNDAGVFELSLRDERYLPFEGAGAIGTWKLELSTNNTDLDAVSDVVLHVRYTAIDGGDSLKTQAQKNTALLLSGLRLFSLKDEFPTEWHHFFTPDAGAVQTLVLPLEKSVFPRSRNGGTPQINAVRLFAAWKDAKAYFAGAPLTMSVAPPSAASVETTLGKGPGALDTLAVSPTLTPAAGTSWAAGSWTLSAAGPVGEGLDNIWVLCDFSRQGA
ncbi:Tc toxin subunit A-related protein [Polyangium mundeleinium]|uniref:Neuraminidase-like domain-containing protein n=1 Tax=Polyangium mundeleinium TaxID=2995306 RepID=A0ABT5EMW0_9BACT|nr:neuraminidase-like domain-containing protein [Polyangium mundeleinium]MDC0743173.1 neuraminidase-like domain-containing protein [Polyangium mundeleinium]